MHTICLYYLKRENVEIKNETTSCYIIKFILYTIKL